MNFDYLGYHRYFVTCCTARRRVVFTSAEAVEPVRTQFLRAAADHRFAVLAYIFMPDHMHWLVEGLSPDADFRHLMMVVRRRTSCRDRRREPAQPPLWQDGYFEHVLRRDDDVRAVAGYILENPVRAGLVSRWQEYPFSWAVGYSRT